MRYPPVVRRRRHGDATAEQIRAGWVDGPPSALVRVTLAVPDPSWAVRFAAEEVRLRARLGDVVVGLEHVGSTAVPGLAAKPIVDIDLVVADSTDEDRYVPSLVALGYRLVLREPWWWGHRMLVSDDDAVNLHVFPVDAAEPVRHLALRDWLRTHDDDRQLYAEVKRRLSGETAADPEAYNLAKNGVIDEIYERIWAADDAGTSSRSASVGW